MLGLAKVLVTLRSDVTYPGDLGGTLHRRTRPPCPVTKPRTLDAVWIPVTAQHGWLAITRDRHIQQNIAEIRAVRDSGARMVALAGKDAGNTWQQLEVLMCQWREIERLLDEAGPFVYSATRTSLHPVPLD